jgi:hypothetical protein
MLPFIRWNFSCPLGKKYLQKSNLVITAWTAPAPWRQQRTEEDKYKQALQAGLSRCFCFIIGTQEWDYFWLPFPILYYFIVNYAKILRFCKKHFWLGHWGGGTWFLLFILTVVNLFSYQRCGTVTIFYCFGSDFWKVTVPVLTFDTLRFRFWKCI